MCLFQKSVAWHAWRKRQWTLACTDQSTQGMVGHATNPRTPEAGRGGRMLHKFKASMVYRGSAKPVRTTQWDSHKYTKNGLPTHSLPKQCLLRYWFPSEGKSVIIMQKTLALSSSVVLLLFKTKKKSSDQSYLVGKICKERITSLAISYLYQFLELLNKTTWKTRANHHKMFYLPFTVIGSVQKFSLIFSKLVNWQKLDNHFQIYWYERDSILWLQKHWGSNKGIKRQN